MIDSHKRTKLTLISLLIVIFSITLIAILGAFFEMENLIWLLPFFTMTIWFTLYCWTLYMVRSNDGILTVAYGFNLLLGAAVVIMACISALIPNIIPSVIMWTIMVIYIGHQIYSILYRPWWFVKKGRTY